MLPCAESRNAAGDLLFYPHLCLPGPVSHVGIYVGGGQMLHAGNPIGYADINSAYWTEHFYAVGRLPAG
ncbi:MAG: C40 family peptidase [Neglectibacter timonensis]